jgi:hypothetical protein
MTLLFEWPTILHLLRTCSPAAISWFVIAIIVSAIQCQFWMWTQSHISNKIAEIFPTFTHLDSSTTPVFPFCVVRICASLNHSSPNAIFRRYMSSKRIAMPEIMFHLKATATPCWMIGSPDIISKKNFKGPAIAETFPSWPYPSPICVIGSSFYDRKFPKLLSCKVDKVGNSSFENRRMRFSVFTLPISIIQSFLLWSHRN